MKNIFEVKSNVKVEFSLSGDYFDVDYVNNIMNVDGATIIKKGETLSNKIRPNIETVWVIKTEYEISSDINIQLQKIIALIYDKKIIIRSLVDKFNLLCVISVVIQINNDVPAIYLEKETVNFLSEIGAMIDIDTYVFNYDFECDNIFNGDE